MHSQCAPVVRTKNSLQNRDGSVLCSRGPSASSSWVGGVRVNVDAAAAAYNVYHEGSYGLLLCQWAVSEGTPVGPHWPLAGQRRLAAARAYYEQQLMPVGTSGSGPELGRDFRRGKIPGKKARSLLVIVPQCRSIAHCPLRQLKRAGSWGGFAGCQWGLVPA
jgi:hypothetical protein